MEISSIILPLVAQQVPRCKAEPWLSSLAVVHTQLKTLMAKECHDRKRDPANQLPRGFSSQGRLWYHGKHAGHTCPHSQHLACKRRSLKFGDRRGTCFNSSIRPKMKQQETKQISIKQEKILSELDGSTEITAVLLQFGSNCSFFISSFLPWKLMFCQQSLPFHRTAASGLFVSSQRSV